MFRKFVNNGKKNVATMLRKEGPNLFKKTDGFQKYVLNPWQVSKKLLTICLKIVDTICLKQKSKYFIKMMRLFLKILAIFAKKICQFFKIIPASAVKKKTFPSMQNGLTPNKTPPAAPLQDALAPIKSSARHPPPLVLNDLTALKPPLGECPDLE